MKFVKSIFVMTIGSILGFQGIANAQEEYIPQARWECKQTQQPYDRLTYVKLGAGSLFDPSFNGVGPAVGIGRRYEFGELGVDVSVNFTQSGRDTFYVSLPRVMMLYYFQPNQPSSFYVGAGGSLAWTQTKRRVVKKEEITSSLEATEDGFSAEEEFYYSKKTKRDTFGGLMADVSIGYEFCRDRPIRSFIELSAGHAVLPFSGKMVNKFNPVVTLTYGIGF